MRANMISGATRVLGKSQGYFGLPVLDLVYADGTPCMVTSWEPNPDELERLQAGAPVLIRILGTQHPPIVVEVGKVPD